MLAKKVEGLLGEGALVVVSGEDGSLTPEGRRICVSCFNASAFSGVAYFGPISRFVHEYHIFVEDSAVFEVA